MPDTVELHFSLAAGFALHLPGRKPIPVRMAMDHDRLLVSDGGQIHFALSGPLAGLLIPDPDPVIEDAETASCFAPPAARVNPRAGGWEWLTPRMVIDHFRNSPVLRAHADDVEAVLAEKVLESEGLASAPPDRLSQDLALVLAAGEDGLFKPDGSANQSEIARRLNIANAGGYRARILAVAEALEGDRGASTTTNARPGQDTAQIRGSGQSAAA